VAEYQEKFEELGALMWNAQPTLTDQYFVSSFISGLKDELRSMVKMMMLMTIRQVAEKARLQKLTLEAIFKKNRVAMRPLPSQNCPIWGSNRPLLLGGPSGGPKVSPLPSCATTMEQRRLMGLCLKCGEKYHAGHQCKRQLLNMEGEEDLSAEDLENEGGVTQEAVILDREEAKDQEGV